jgi:hypothetical protein
VFAGTMCVQYVCKYSTMAGECYKLLMPFLQPNLSLLRPAERLKDYTACHKVGLGGGGGGFHLLKCGDVPHKMGRHPNISMSLKCPMVDRGTFLMSNFLFKDGI